MHSAGTLIFAPTHGARARRRRRPPRSITPTAGHSSPPGAAARHGRGGTVLFEVRFTSSMTDAELGRLARWFDLSTSLHPKQHPDPTSPGVARLDHFSGVYLERGASEDEWVLEGRTWGHPAPESVHEWHVVATGAAHELDPTVTPPQPLAAVSTTTPTRLVGQVESRRMAGLRRRLVGLP